MDTIIHPDPVVRRIAGVIGEASTRSSLPGLTISLRSAQPPIVLSRGRFSQPTSKRLLLVKWVLAGKAMLGVDGRRIPFGVNQVAIHFPSMTHAFWVLEEGTEMCWASVDGHLAESFALGIGLRAGIMNYGSAPVQEIMEMNQSLKDKSLDGLRRSSFLAIKWLYEIAGRCMTPPQQNPAVVDQAKQIIEQHFADPDLSAASIAQRLQHHRGTVSRLFHQATGITLISYITQVRLQAARALLEHTPDKISEVARKCGVRGHVYFCRWIRKHTGLSPQQIRNGALFDRHDGIT